MSELTMPWREQATPASCMFVGVPGSDVLVISGNGTTPKKLPGVTPSWGDCSRDTIALAAAILSASISDRRIARALAQPFASAVLAHVPAGESWSLSDTIVRSIAARLATH